MKSDLDSSDCEEESPLARYEDKEKILGPDSLRPRRVKIGDGDESEDDLFDGLDKPAANLLTIRNACDQILEMYLDEEFFNLGHEIGRCLRWGDLDAMGLLANIADEYLIIDAPGMDIFGNLITKKYNFECECPKCHRTLAATRFAPHLEKCMGMGRNSSRIASRRLAAASSSASSSAASTSNDPKQSGSGAAGGQSQNPNVGELGSEDDHFEEDDDDEDWSLDRKKKTKKSNERVAVKRKGPLSRVKNAEATAKGKRGAGASPSVQPTEPPASAAADAAARPDNDDPHVAVP